MTQIVQTLWYLLFQVDFDISSRHKDGSYYCSMMAGALYSLMLSYRPQRGIFFNVQVFKQIPLPLNTNIDLLPNGRNWYP